MYHIEISNHCTVQLDFLTNAVAVQAHLDEAFEAVMAEFCTRDAYQRAAHATAVKGASRTEAGRQTAAFNHYCSIYAAAAILTVLRASRRNSEVLFAPTLYRRCRSHSFPE